jgi:hypothetical protein
LFTASFATKKIEIKAIADTVMETMTNLIQAEAKESESIVCGKKIKTTQNVRKMLPSSLSTLSIEETA